MSRNNATFIRLILQTRENKISGQSFLYTAQFVIFNPLSYCFEGTIGFDVKASFASRPESRLIR